MSPTEIAYIELPGLGGLMCGEGAHLVAGEVVILQEWDRLVALSISSGSVLWTVPKPRPSPADYNVPRRARVSGRGLWRGPGLVAHLSDAPSGVCLTAHETATGRTMWQLQFETPPALPWTESKPAYDDAKTEELSAFLTSGDQLVVAMARTTRRAYRLGFRPPPPFNAQLDLWGVDATTGQVRWHNELPDVSVPILEKWRLSHCLARTGSEVLAIDLSKGVTRFRTKLQGKLGWPRPHRERSWSHGISAVL